ncbi:hypothetical protein [Caulobacter sp. 17J65-9]|uniref:hypothetical protein n=1 Tax=Caulobacter sp. 17J65-9 TaxID=2709382 RepID=UPI0013C64D3E|nr:hypothetical protein [Caulobacter sp. 17J65-9]NEX94855.1 hypothetical protein [Caulobacter sp. 17J65-9]
MTKRIIAGGLVAAALAASVAAGAYAQDHEPPALWSGAGGLAFVASSQQKVGSVGPGDVVAQLELRARRTARLAEDYVPGEGAAVVPAGTPFYAVEIEATVREGAAPPPRARYLSWCVARQAPALCLRWVRPGTVETSPADGAGPLLRRSPMGFWREVPEPKLVEQPVALEPYEELFVVKSIGPTGVVLSDVSRQGADERAFDRTVAWGQAVGQQPGGPMLRFTPVRADDGQPTRAQVERIVPKEQAP